jgi:transketolase
MTMRDRFTAVTAAALDRDERLALVLADIGVRQFEATGVRHRHPRRVVNVGIREQLMIGVAAGLALEGFRPIVHSYAPFLVERPFEQLKLDFGHQGLGAVLAGTGGSYDAAAEGRTHQAPEDVAVLSTLPGWTIDVPGHPDEAEQALHEAFAGDGRVYVRLSDEANAAPLPGDALRTLRRGSDRAPVVVAVGPTLDAALAATADLDATVTYLSRVRPFDAAGLRAALRGTDVVLVEPYLAGTSAAEISAAFSDRPHRLLALGVRSGELRRYGHGAEHRAAHGLDAAGIRRSLAAFSAVAGARVADAA